MPVYEYECSNCSCRFELKQKFSDSPEASCPQCKASARRVFSPVPIIFKGTGFYVTEHRKESENKPANRRDGDKPASTGEKSPEGSKKKEATPDTKAENQAPKLSG